MNRRREVRLLLKRVLDQAVYSMRQIAEGAGVHYVSVREWKRGKRVAGHESRLRLASAFRKHAARLQELAEELEQSVEEER
jgi:transposase